MRNILLLTLSSMLLFSSCKNEGREEAMAAVDAESAYDSYGAQSSGQKNLSSEEMMMKYENLKTGDTLELSFEGKVNSVCKNKGCWMELDLPGEENVMVKFKDYGFFVPKDIEERNVLIEGKAYVAEVSVEEQRHYAEDNGKSEAEVAQITQPKRTLSFIANGVRIKKTE